MEQSTTGLRAVYKLRCFEMEYACGRQFRTTVRDFFYSMTGLCAEDTILRARKYNQIWLIP
jgi:hypothetical protein